MRLAIVLLLLWTLLVAPLAACPSCEVALDEETGGNNSARGYFASILLMLGTLGGLSAGLLLLIARVSSEDPISGS